MRNLQKQVKKAFCYPILTSYSQYFHIVFQLTSYDIDIPNDIEGKKIVKLTRKATNWGPDYLFHSCADVEFVKLSVSKY